MKKRGSRETAKTRRERNAAPRLARARSGLSNVHFHFWINDHAHLRKAESEYDWGRNP